MSEGIHIYLSARFIDGNFVNASVCPIIRPTCYIFLKHWGEYNQTCYMASPHGKGVQEQCY